MATKNLRIVLDEVLLRDIDDKIKQDLRTRSEYFISLAIADMSRRKRWEQLFAAGKSVSKQMGISSEEQVYKIIKN